MLAYAELSPHAVWMRMIAAGAAFAAAAGLIEIVWHVLWLGTRVRGYPRLETIRLWQPFVLMSQVALQWVAAWMLTTHDPSPHRRRRLLANLLRFAVTVSFLLFSADALRLYEGLSWQTRTTWWSAAQFVDLIVTLLFWPYAVGLAVHLGSRGLAVRAGAGLVLSVVGWTCIVGPRLLGRMAGIWFFTDRYYQNIGTGINVLCATIAVLVLLRFAMRFRDEAELG